jgi:NADH-quinone oxidoreductase subunit L
MHRGDTLGWVLYGMGMIAAICTAFYTFRMMGLTFFGEWRGEEKVYAHAHEAPPSMAMPLIILAFFAAVAGFLWLPPALADEGGALTSFKTWLDPIWSSAQSMLPADSHFRMATTHDDAAIRAEWINIFISSVVAIGMVLVSFTIYSKAANIEKVKKLALKDGKPTALYRLLQNQYYVDEIYDMIIVRPLKLVSDVLFVVVDVVVIVLVLVRGSAEVVRVTSDLGRRIQTGVVRHYLYAFAIGAVVLTALFLMIAQR